MKHKMIWVAVSINLVALLILVFVYPHLMVSPGALVPAHQEMATDCFACHTPLRGVSSQRCSSCHALADIGVRTTKGIRIQAKSLKTPFHQQLVQQDCIACHTDHAGLRQTAQRSGRFSHDLLREPVRDQCVSCHKPPDNRLHRDANTSCKQCHTQAAWKPAHFDHSKSFVLDGDHNTSCATCHTKNDYSQYTCYGCHEHTPQNVRNEHRGEDINKLNDCVQCHRQADGEGED